MPDWCLLTNRNEKNICYFTKVFAGCFVYAWLIQQRFDIPDCILVKQQFYFFTIDEHLYGAPHLMLLVKVLSYAETHQQLFTIVHLLVFILVVMVASYHSVFNIIAV